MHHPTPPQPSTPPPGRPGRADPRDLEAVIDRHPFDGQPLGASLTDYLQWLWLGNRPAPHRDVARLGRDVALGALRPGPGAHHGPLPPGSVLCTSIADSPRLTELVLPIARELLELGAPVTVLGRTSTPPRGLPAGVGHLDGRLAPPLDQRRWWRQLRPVALAWLRALGAATRSGTVPAAALPRLVDLLFEQSRRYTRSQALLRELAPAVVLTEFDRSWATAPLVLAARSLGIPTVTLVHGVVGARGYTPLLADRALCWGSRQRDALVRAGTDPARLDVTGCPRAREALDVDVAAVGRRLGLGPDEVVVTLGTNHGDPLAERTRLAELFCEATSELPGVRGVLRPHPAEDVAAYEAVLRRFPRVVLQPGGTATVEESIALSQLVAYRGSGYADDAVTHGRPAIRLLPGGSGAPGGGATPIGLGPDGLEARTAGELRQIVERYLGDDAYRRHWQERAARAGLAVAAHRGRQAAQRSAQAVLAHRGPAPGSAPRRT